MLKIGNGTGTYSTTKSGDDIIVTVGDGKISLVGAASLSKLNISGKKIDTPPSDTTTLTVTNSTKSPVTIGADVKIVDASTRKKAVKITGNVLDNEIMGGTKNDTLDGAAGDDNLTGGKGDDVFIYSAGNDTITDYGNGSDKISLGAATIESFSVTDGNVELDLDKGSITIANGADKKVSLVSGKKTTANIFTNDGIFDTSGKSVTLNASVTNYTADKNVATIDAGLTSGATITGNSKANIVYFGDENVFIWAKGGNDTLMNFGADDLLSISGAVSDGSISSGNSVIKIGTNKITVKDSSQVTFADNDGTRIFDGGIFYDADKTSATLASSTKNFTATDNVTDITGNAKANKLYAGDENTTLTGGKGNDSLWGGDGSDTFLYTKGDGKDVIYGFGDNDLLEVVGLGDKVTGTFNKAGTELTVKVGSTAVSVLKDFGSTTTFNVTANGTAHQIIK